LLLWVGAPYPKYIVRPPEQPVNAREAKAALPFLELALAGRLERHGGQRVSLV